MTNKQFKFQNYLNDNGRLDIDAYLNSPDKDEDMSLIEIDLEKKGEPNYLRKLCIWGESISQAAYQDMIDNTYTSFLKISLFLVDLGYVSKRNLLDLYLESLFDKELLPRNGKESLATIYKTIFLFHEIKGRFLRGDE